VVIVIIGIILAIATVSVSVLGRDTEVEDQTRRLHAVLMQVREEAELQGRDLGLLIEKGGYRFMRYNYPGSQWQVLENDEMLAYHPLPKGLQFRLWLDSREVILKSHADNQELLESASSSESSGASSSAPTGPTSSAGRGIQPQIAILSSGDIVPFELRLARDDNPFYWRLLGSADNSLNLEPGSNTR
jgi:general secretion pathway protein H